MPVYTYYSKKQNGLVLSLMGWDVLNLKSWHVGENRKHWMLARQ